MMRKNHLTSTGWAQCPKTIGVQIVPYYNIYIGGEPYKLYIGKQQYDLYIHGDLPETIYGKLSFTFDEANQQFRVKIDQLNSRARHLLSQKKLQLALEVESNQKIYRGAMCRGNPHESIEKSKMGKRDVYSNGFRSGEWFCPHNMKKVTIDNMGDEIIYPTTYISLRPSSRLHGMWFNFTRGEGIDKSLDYWLNMRFYLYSTAGRGRFHKTLTSAFQLKRPNSDMNGNYYIEQI